MSLVLVAALIFGSAQPPTLTIAALGNHAFVLGSTNKQTITLKNGQWTSREGVKFELRKAHAIADLDGDGNPEASVIVQETARDGGIDSHLLVFGMRGGKIEQIGEAAYLFDAEVLGVFVRDGVLTVRMATLGPDDRPGAPTLRVERQYRLVDGRLELEVGC